MTLSQVSERLGAHPQRVYVLVEEGVLHPVRLPGKARIYYAEWEVEQVRIRDCLGTHAA